VNYPEMDGGRDVSLFVLNKLMGTALEGKLNELEGSE
jgi:hypothetical protein